jgi:hypothetical protein
LERIRGYIGKYLGQTVLRNGLKEATRQIKGLKQSLALLEECDEKFDVVNDWSTTLFSSL